MHNLAWGPNCSQDSGSVAGLRLCEDYVVVQFHDFPMSVLSDVPAHLRALTANGVGHTPAVSHTTDVLPAGSSVG